MRKPARHSGLDKNTVWRWRMLVFSIIGEGSAVDFTGFVEPLINRAGGFGVASLRHQVVAGTRNALRNCVVMPGRVANAFKRDDGIPLPRDPEHRGLDGFSPVTKEAGYAARAPAPAPRRDWRSDSGG